MFPVPQTTVLRFWKQPTLKALKLPGEAEAFKSLNPFLFLFCLRERKNCFF